MSSHITPPAALRAKVKGPADLGSLRVCRGGRYGYTFLKQAQP
jgi:hypothetical protein